MTRAYIFLNGVGEKEEFYKKLDFKNSSVYCADGGYRQCLKAGAIPKEVWGDFDSVSDSEFKDLEDSDIILRKFSKEKDSTDGELLIEYVSSKNYDEIYVLCGLGGRLDHELTNINLLFKYKNINIKTEKELLFSVDRKYTFINKKNKIISFVPFSDEVRNMNLKGFKYPLNDYLLKRGDSRCMSNIVCSDEATVDFNTGRLLCILND
ncbi:MAG: thiamine diphosphokinase [Cetobacterium sp.]|uniref:thiamine diphosphokinase n=1 Tax=unclassified Cetobacterium TaxID=2630983 RepID=UPI0021048C8F|nr:thiamine diphosphokinase [Cetobacterium sp. 2A]